MISSCLYDDDDTPRRSSFAVAHHYDDELFFLFSGTRRFSCFSKHCIATSRCRKTEWLLCGAHYDSVGRAVLPRSQTNAVGRIVALTEHQLHGD